MLQQNVFVTLNQIMLYCVAALKSAVLQLHCVATTGDSTSLDYKGRMLGFHKMYSITYQTGDVINIFASVKI